METFKEIDIKYYDNSGNVQVRCTVPVTQDSLVHYELMQSHYCKLSFKLSKPIYFLLGDFIDTPYGRFELIDLTKVKDNDTIGYSYEIQFDAYYRKLKNKILKYRPNTGSQEATFSLTSKISTHVELIMKSLSYYAKLDKSYLYDPKFIGEGTDYTYVIDASVDASASKLITYSNASILDAIANIAQTFNCEWWFEGNILHFGTCENTNAIVDFKLDGNIVSMSSSQNQSAYANRVYAFGAARNLPSGYKKDADADITKDGVVEKRLMLPTSAECSDKNKQLLTENGFELKNGYIQVSGLREDQYVEGVTTNDDIYPRNLIKTSNVTSYEKDVEDESTPEEGDLIKRTFYRVGSLTIIGEDGEKTGDMAFRKSYILSGKSLHIVFQSGSLNGMDFECEFNPDGVEEILKDKDGNPILKDGKEQINPKSQVFEIVANEDYGRFLPDITLHPKDGDTFVLYNWDSSKLGNTLVSSASNELLTDAIKNLKKSMIDPTTYTCTAEANYSYNQGMGNLHGVGDRVNLYNKGYGDSYRSSRIIGYEFCLDIPYDGAKYYVGEKPSYSRLNAMESKIEELVYNGQSYLNNGGGPGGSSIYIIKSYDKTSPTEYNVYSARAVDKRYLSKLTDDTAEGLITFAKGLIAKGLADLMMGARFGNSAKITNLGEAFLSAIKSLDYDNAAEQGFSVEKEKNGKYHAFFTNLTIWGKARFHELEVRKLSYSGGNIYLSGAGSKLIKVVPVKQSVSNGVTTWVEMTKDDAESECVGWKCYLLADDGTTATMNYWQEGDQARCQTMGEIVSGGTYQNTSNKSYWRTIPDGGVSTQNEKIYGTKTETYLDEDGNEQTREVQVELYDGQAFAWIVIGKHCRDIDGYDDEFSVDDNGSNPAPLETRDVPSAGDTIVLDGNRHRDENTGKYDKTDRQNVIILETTGEYAPRIACYANITEYKHTFTKRVNGSDKEVSLSVFETSPKGGTKINSSRFEWISDDGSTINIINYRGDWVDGNHYHKNDQVNHNNAVWVCVANSGVDVTEEPRDGATYWKKVLSGGKGDKGDDAVSYGIQFSERITTISSVETKVLGVRFIKSVGQQITSGSINDIDFNGSCVVYIDGVMNGTMSNRLNSGQTYLDIYHAFADEIKGKKGLSVELRNSDAIVVASNTFSFVESGEGVVMAYKNATSRPSEPTVEDLSQLSDGWSRTPQKGGSHEKVSNVSYGNYSAGNTDSGYSTSEWSEVSDSGETWRKSPAGLGNSGWALMKVSFTTNVDNSDVKFIIKAYSEYNCDFIQVHALDTEITGSPALRLNGVFNESGNGVESTHSFTSVKAGQHFFYVSYCKDVSINSNGDYGLFRFDLSDNLASMPSTVWMSQAVLKEGKAVLPWSTPVQITGADAYRVVVSPSVLIFDTDDNGRVTSLSGKTATIRVYQGDKDVSNQFSKYDRLPSNYYNCNGSLKDLNKSPLEIQVTEIDTQVVTDTAGNESTISKTNGFLEFILTNGSANVTAHVDVQVNVAKFTGQMVNTNKRFSLQHQQLSNAVNDKVGSSELKQFKAEITQTAREISLSVSEKSVGRRNMLVGSACRKYWDGFMYMSGAESGYYDGYPLEQIEKNSGIDGVNCIHCRTKQTGTGSYYLSGFRWHGISPQGNIKLERGKKYVLSFYAKTHTPNDIYFIAEVLYQGSKIDTSRPAGYDGPTGYSTTVSASEADKWELFTVKVSVPSDAPYEYVEINIFARARSYSFVGGYICKPMLEEGENYNGWTLSEQDYDYVGGNMLDNARTLDKSGTLVIINDTVIQNGYGTDSACIKNLMQANATLSDYKEVLRWIFGSTYLVNGNDYIFSFVAKADVDDARVVCYMWSGDIENSCDIFTEGNGGTWDSRSDGNIVFILSRQWTRYWVHWRPKDGYATPKEVIIRHTGNKSTSASTVYVTQPKLEIGATMTEWTERKTDLVDKASLKAAGILVDAESVTLYGNQVHIKKNKTDANDTVLIDNETGQVSAELINAEKVVAEGIKAKNLEATNLNVTGNSKFGIWEIRKDDTFGEMIQARGDLQLPSGHTAQGSGVQYLPLYIRGGLANANYFRVGVSCTEFSYSYNGRDFCGVWTGKAADYVCGSVANTAFNTPTEYGYDESYHPAEYIYTTKSLPNDPALAINVVKTKGSSDGERTAIQTNAAIRGVLAPNSMSISRNNDTIPSGIGVVICTNGSEITLTLPANPIEGQTLIIIQGSDKRVYIVPYGDEVIYCSGQTRDKSNKFFSGMIGQFNIFVFIRGNWQLQFVNNRA